MSGDMEMSPTIEKTTSGERGPKLVESSDFDSSEASWDGPHGLDIQDIPGWENTGRLVVADYGFSTEGDFKLHQKRMNSYRRVLLLIGFFYMIPSLQVVMTLKLESNKMLATVERIGSIDTGVMSNIVCKNGRDSSNVYMMTGCSNSNTAPFGEGSSKIFTSLIFVICALPLLAVFHYQPKQQGSCAEEAERGVFKNVGLYYSAAMALMMHGLFSLLYFVCMCKLTAQFRDMFWFISLGLDLVIMYHKRHGTRTLEATKFYIIAGLFVILNVCDLLIAEYGPGTLPCHTANGTAASNSTAAAYTKAITGCSEVGTTQSPASDGGHFMEQRGNQLLVLHIVTAISMILITIWLATRAYTAANFEGGVRGGKRRPHGLLPHKLLPLLFITAINFSLCVLLVARSDIFGDFGHTRGKDSEKEEAVVAQFLEIVLLFDVSMYIIHYLVRKICAREPIPRRCFLPAFLFCVCATLALYIALDHNAKLSEHWVSSAVPDAADQNYECYLMFNFFDYRDLFRISVAMAQAIVIHLMYMLDDGIHTVPQTMIAVF